MLNHAIIEPKGRERMYQPIGARIKALRELRGLTQGQLAYKASTAASHISLLENDGRPGAHAATLAAIAKALGTTVDYLVGLTDDSGIPHGQNNLPPELLQAAREIQDIWRRVHASDPEAAQELASIAVIQGRAFEVAVSAALRRLEREEQPEE